MSVPPRRRLPERPSLEQLRKQAKEHLDTLRAADPSVNLAAAQHALAREYGFESWPKLVHHVESMQPANRMLQPAALKSEEKLLWSPGRGTDVWALMQACASGDLKAVRELIAKDPSLARSHYHYRKPLYFAVRENRIDVVRFLLEHDRNPLDLWVDDDPIEMARDRGYAEMEQLLAHTFETRFNASTKGEPVAAALREHDLKRMRELLDAQPELLGKGDKRSNQPIHWATMTRQLDAIDELLRRGADINAQRIDGGRPIHLTNGDYFYRGWRDVPRNWPVTPAQVMAHLKARGAFIDLPTACHTGDIERVRELLRAGSITRKQAWRVRGVLPRGRRAAVKRRCSRAHGHRPAAARSRRRPQSARRADCAQGQGALPGRLSRALRDREAPPRAWRLSESACRKFGRRAVGIAGISSQQAHGAVAPFVRRHTDAGAPG